MPTDEYSPQIDNAAHAMVLALKVGELDGKLSSVVDRQARHETWVGQKLDSMDTKLDTISVHLANTAGKTELAKSLSSPALWLISAGVSCAAWLATHFVILPHH